MNDKEGKLTKLKISGYKDNRFKEATNLSYEVLFNPEEFHSNYELEYKEGKASGRSSPRLKFQGIKPQTLDLNLIFDGTGSIPGTEGVSVHDQIESFKKVALYYDGDLHEPPYVRVQWGNLIFQGKLQSFKVTYNLFAQNGTPLRAKAAASFKEVVSDKKRAAKENKKSSDLTHLVKVKGGDTLPQLAFKVYNDSSYYLELARINNLTSFRKLTAGSQLVFPPLEK